MRRLDGIRLKKPDMIREAVVVDLYSKFDDWPPGKRMEGEDALKQEEAAIGVLDEYHYKLDNLTVAARGDLAWASFYLTYNGSIRKKTFNLSSRVSMVLVKSDSDWRIVHEHFSVIPDAMPVSEPRPAANEAEASEKPKDEVQEAVMKVLSDSAEKHIAELTHQVSEILGRTVTASEVVERCDALVKEGKVTRKGRFYPRYTISPDPQT